MKLIPPAKIAGLRAALESGPVDFNNGSRVERHGDKLIVTRPAGGVAYFDAATEIEAAYSMALEGPRRKQQPSSDGSRFGDRAPF